MKFEDLKKIKDILDKNDTDYCLTIELSDTETITLDKTKKNKEKEKFEVGFHG